MRVELNIQYQKYYAANKEFPHILKYFPLAAPARYNIPAQAFGGKCAYTPYIYKMWLLLYGFIECIR